MLFYCCTFFYVLYFVLVDLFFLRFHFFQIAASRPWNNLPQNVTSALSLTGFWRNRLKTRLFIEALGIQQAWHTRTTNWSEAKSYGKSVPASIVQHNSKPSCARIQGQLKALDQQLFNMSFWLFFRKRPKIHFSIVIFPNPCSSRIVTVISDTVIRLFYSLICLLTNSAFILSFLARSVYVNHRCSVR